MTPELADLPVQTVTNPDWEQGMGSSLTVGLQALEAPATESLDAVLVLLCDQPLVTAAHLRTLFDRYAADKNPVVASEYSPDVLGPPCLFARPFFGKLRAVSPAQGARALLGRLSGGRVFAGAVSRRAAGCGYTGGLGEIHPSPRPRITRTHPSPKGKGAFAA
jgi:molybdenum cofactor cytidylyltransferase